MEAVEAWKQGANITHSRRHPQLFNYRSSCSYILVGYRTRSELQSFTKLKLAKTVQDSCWEVEFMNLKSSSHIQGLCSHKTQNHNSAAYNKFIVSSRH